MLNLNRILRKFIRRGKNATPKTRCNDLSLLLWSCIRKLPLYFEVFTFKDFSEMILAAITVTILFEPLVERALASETFLLISRPGHVGNVFTIEFIVHDLLSFHLVRISINGIVYRKLRLYYFYKPSI